MPSVRKIGGFKEENMRIAVEKVVKDGLTLRKAAEKYQMKFQTLSRYVLSFALHFLQLNLIILFISSNSKLLFDPVSL